MVVETVPTTRMKKVALREETRIPPTMWMVPIVVPTSLRVTTTGGVWTKLAVATAVSTARIVPMRSIVLPGQILKLPHTTKAPVQTTSLPVMATVGVLIQARGATVVEIASTTLMNRIARIRIMVQDSVGPGSLPAGPGSAFMAASAAIVLGIVPGEKMRVTA